MQDHVDTAISAHVRITFEKKRHVFFFPERTDSFTLMAALEASGKLIVYH